MLTTMTAPRGRVVLVDDHELIRDGLRLAFRRAEDLEVVGEAGSVRDAIDLVESLMPDVVVTDVRLPDGDGVTLASRLRAQHPELGIVVLTMLVGDEHLFAALAAGASAFVGKDAPTGDVVAAARHAVVAPRAFSAPDLAQAMERRAAGPAGPRLSKREYEVLLELVDGRDVRQVGRKLFISESTVKTHVGKLYKKLGVGNRAELVMAAIRLGLIDGKDPD